jgi:hypothetical protein
VAQATKNTGNAQRNTKNAFFMLYSPDIRQYTLPLPDTQCGASGNSNNPIAGEYTPLEYDKYHSNLALTRPLPL